MARNRVSPWLNEVTGFVLRFRPRIVVGVVARAEWLQEPIRSERAALLHLCVHHTLILGFKACQALRLSQRIGFTHRKTLIDVAFEVIIMIWFVEKPRFDDWVGWEVYSTCIRASACA